MGDPRAFLKTKRAKAKERPVDERVKAYVEFVIEPDRAELETQAARCMDCGIPFCHQGCPLGNLIPEWNDLVYRKEYDAAERRLLETNNFPEITGRICPAPCEASCVLNLEESPVTIKDIERNIAEHERKRGYRPEPPRERSGRRVAVVGSGPAGLATAQQLARRGHLVTVFERDDRIGGLLRYGIPDFKLEKDVIDERLAQLEAEGVTFRTGASVEPKPLLADFDAVVLAIGARTPRDLPVEGRALGGVHFAMDFLTQQNRRVAGDDVPGSEAILATGKDVIVLGGGDTGSDCVGTSIRQGAKSVVQVELMPRPSLVRMPDNPWPEWPLVLRTSSSQEEGCERDFAVKTVNLVADDGGARVSGLAAVRIELRGGTIVDQVGTEVTFPADLVLLAMGFTGPERGGLVESFGLALDSRGNIAADTRGHTSVPRVFATGDASRGQSLVVWAIADGRRVADGVDEYLRAEAASRLVATG